MRFDRLIVIYGPIGVREESVVACFKTLYRDLPGGTEEYWGVSEYVGMCVWRIRTYLDCISDEIREKPRF